MEILTSKKIRYILPDLPELITPPVSSQADDDDDDLVSSSTVSPLRRIDSSDVQRLFDEPFLPLVRPPFISFIGLVCVEMVLQVPFVMGMSSKSSSIFNTGKSLLSPDFGKLKCFEYFSNNSVLYFRWFLGVMHNCRSFGLSTLNDCSGMYVCFINRK